MATNCPYAPYPHGGRKGGRLQTAHMLHIHMGAGREEGRKGGRKEGRKEGWKDERKKGRKEDDKINFNLTKQLFN